MVEIRKPQFFLSSSVSLCPQSQLSTYFLNSISSAQLLLLFTVLCLYFTLLALLNMPRFCFDVCLFFLCTQTKTNTAQGLVFNNVIASHLPKLLKEIICNDILVLRLFKFHSCVTYLLGPYEFSSNNNKQ